MAYLGWSRLGIIVMMRLLPSLSHQIEGGDAVLDVSARLARVALEKQRSPRGGGAATSDWAADCRPDLTEIQ
jgi:hypothetical protein